MCTLRLFPARPLWARSWCLSVCLSVSGGLLLRTQQRSGNALPKSTVWSSQPTAVTSADDCKRGAFLPDFSPAPTPTPTRGLLCLCYAQQGSREQASSNAHARAIATGCPHGLGRQDAPCLGPGHGGRAHRRRRRAGPEAGRADELEGGGGHGRAHAAVGEPSAAAAAVVRAVEAAAPGPRAAGGAGVLRAGLRRRPLPVPRLPPPPQGLRGALQGALRHRRRPAAALLPAVQQVCAYPPSLPPSSCRIVSGCVRTDASPRPWGSGRPVAMHVFFLTATASIRSVPVSVAPAWG